MPRLQSSISNGKPMLAAFSIAVSRRAGGGPVGGLSLPGRLKRSQIGLEPAAIWRMSDKDVLGKALRQILHLYYEASG